MKASPVKFLGLAVSTCLAMAVVLAGAFAESLASDAKADVYPAPRWRSYLKRPKSVEDILPHARNFVRNKAAFGGNSSGLGLGLRQPGEEVMIVPATTGVLWMTRRCGPWPLNMVILTSC
jgi:hypothetical protein